MRRNPLQNGPRASALGLFARAGFQALQEAREGITELSGIVAQGEDGLLDAFSFAADPDTALIRIIAIAERHPELLPELNLESWRRLCLLVGASPAFGEFFLRQPATLRELLGSDGALVTESEALRQLGAAVRDSEGSVLTAETGWNALRVRYRELLAGVMLHDLSQSRAGEADHAFDAVAKSLTDLATATLATALDIARANLVAGCGVTAVPAERLAQLRFSVLAFGKCGAGELNVVSDVDVMFIAEPLETAITAGGSSTVADSSALDGDAAIRIATRLATELMRAIHDPALEPPLWQVDANLRPEGRQGPLVRSLGSMLNYYDRWAKTWEFQALLKARAVAGDRTLGQEFIDRTRPLVWASSTREDFVGNVQRMRERVTEYISEDELEVQLKLGPGGLRDVEFSVQLLQLVHGQYDERLHLRGTLESLEALVDGGYVARSDGDRLAEDYRRLRVLEHRLQLRELRRTEIMPRDEDGLRILARASGFASTGLELRRIWEGIKREIRDLHLKIFYAPLLSAVAALPETELVLGSAEARARLASIGFRDPDGAMRHLTALTQGTSRRAKIQRNLMPVLLHWLATGTDPDAGLLAFRRLSEANLGTPWYLRLLRDGSEAAERLMRVLANSRFVGELLVSIPEAVGWLERDALLQPVSLDSMLEEMRALAARRETVDDAATALRAVHRREILRLALGRLVGVIGDAAVAEGLDSAHTALLDGLLLALRQHAGDETPVELELALIGMGRYGGRELGFASDLDLIAVYRAPAEMNSEVANRAAVRLVSELRRLVSDPRFTVDLDFDLRPEGKNGPLARSLEAYRAYYERWSVTWEAQALLRARPVAGHVGLGEDFIALADRTRYPERFDEGQVREVRRLKARMEAERLPQGAEPKRHLKLGPGGLSDVEWLVQLIQLREGSQHEALRTISTLGALQAAEQLGLLDSASREQLVESWRLASSLRSAAKLWAGRNTDVLPRDRAALEGISGVLGLPRAHTGELEERWFAVSRRARTVFEREFFGYDDDPVFPRF